MVRADYSAILRWQLLYSWAGIDSVSFKSSIKFLTMMWCSLWMSFDVKILASRLKYWMKSLRQAIASSNSYLFMIYIKISSMGGTRWGGKVSCIYLCYITRESAIQLCIILNAFSPISFASLDYKIHPARVSLMWSIRFISKLKLNISMTSSVLITTQILFICR